MNKMNKMNRMNKMNKMNKFYKETDMHEIGIDEVGRGPLFGRVYTACVILPKLESFKYELLKDSKKFTSEKKLIEVCNYIKENAIAWSVTYEEEYVIDKINIRQAIFNSMHNSINEIILKMNDNNYLKYYLLIDGIDFKPYIYYNNDLNILEQMNHILIKDGDNTYCSIAAASIIAKVERDNYIKELCKKYVFLDEYYGLNKNKGYGTLQHIEGIKKYGITKMHRKTFGICKIANIIELEIE